MTLNTRQTQPGFTLIELLAVMGLMAVIIGLSFPILRKLGEFSQGAAGVNSVSVAVNAARIYSQRISYPDMGDGMGSDDPYPPEARYSGTAVLFTPSGEIRLVINDRPAQGATYEDDDTLFLEANGATAYNDIPGIDYIKMPRGSGIVGVRRTGPNADDIELLPPPFAIRFDRAGQLTVRNDPATDFIYYDGDGDKFFKRTGPNSNRASLTNYDPDDWDGRLHSSLARTSDDSYELPFEEIEVVASVLLYDAREFRGLRGKWPNTPPEVDEYTTGTRYSSPEEYLLDRDDNGELINSTAIFFSRHSGFALPRE